MVGWSPFRAGLANLPAEHPHVAGSGDRFGGRFRDVVRITATFARRVGEQPVEVLGREPGEGQVEPEALQVGEFDRQLVLVP